MVIGRSGNVLVVRGDDPEYPEIAGMLASGSVRLVGERYDERGRRVVAVAAPGTLRPNEGEGEKGFVRIGADYYTLALKDYDDWQEKWWREAIQNAVDSGATNVACRVDPLSNGGAATTSYEVSCEDDGPGMDRETLLDRFLVLGGTTKRTGETTGGFGKAKELLILPWIRWRIETRGFDVKGAGGVYEIRTGPARAGTKLTVVMPADNPTSEAAAWALIGKCYLPRVKFTVNGEPARAALSPGEILREFEGKAALSQNKRGTFEGSMLIRANGLYMFGRRVPQEVRGTLIVELLRPSVELLTANRDGFREKSLGWAMEEFASELGADVRSALKKKGLIRERFQGTGKFRGISPKDVAGEMAEALAGAVGGKKAGHVVRLTQSDVDQMLLRLRAMAPSGDSPETSEEGLDLRIDDQIAGAMLGGLGLRGQHQAESAAKQLAWQPDFFLVNEIEDWHVPKKFRPEAMTPTIAKLARLWAELCRFVLVQLGSSEAYGVGFIFAESAASQLSEQGEQWLLLNPFKTPTDTAGPLWSVSDEDDLMQLYAMAMHEVTHLADGVSYHNESFTSAFTHNVALCSGKDAQVRKIRKAVVARKPSPRGEAEKAFRGIARLAKKLTVEESVVLRAVVALEAEDGPSHFEVGAEAKKQADLTRDEVMDALYSLEEKGLVRTVWSEQAGKVWRATPEGATAVGLKTPAGDLPTEEQYQVLRRLYLAGTHASALWLAGHAPMGSWKLEVMDEALASLVANGWLSARRGGDRTMYAISKEGEKALLRAEALR